MANNIVNSSTIGVNLQGNSDGASANFALGSHVLGNAGSEWIYVSAINAITTGQLVTINATFSAQAATATLAFGSATPSPGQTLAFAQGAFAAADFGWVALRGDNLAVALSSASTLGVPLYIGQSGSITVIAASGTLAGIILQGCSATAVLNAATTAFVTWPRMNAGGTLGQ